MTAYQPCHDAFIRYCSALAYGKMDTEDLVQDVLLSAYTHFDKIKKKDQLLHYLVRAARNRSVSFLRRKKFKAEWLERHDDHLRSQGISPETLLDIQLLQRMLDKLPKKQKHAILLFEISGFSMREIAAIQHSTEGAVKTRISRGRKRLRHLMSDTAASQPVTHILRTVKTIL
ncbi:MAG: RNA polymerase sigma factor [Bacteroidota bacterium]